MRHTFLPIAAIVLLTACSDVRDDFQASLSGGMGASSTATDGSGTTGAGPGGPTGGSITDVTSTDDPPADDTASVFDVGSFPDAPVLCSLPAVQSCDGQDDDPFHALGLGCPGPADQTIPISDAVFASSDSRAWAVASSFGTAVDPNSDAPLWGAREGEKVLIVSSGVLAEPDGDGAVTLPAGFAQHGASGTGGNANYNGDAKPLPAPMSAYDGSNGGAGGMPFVDCDLVGDCSGSLPHQWELGGGEANDLLWFSFTAEAPPEATGFSIDFAYFSAEFSEWVGSPYNDVLAMWAQNDDYVGNLCFVGSDPCTVTALWPALYQEGAPELAGTGFEGVGGSTGWFVARGPVRGGDTVRITFAIFDMGDTILDTTVLLDHFQWECDGCDPNLRDCGVTPEG